MFALFHSPCPDLPHLPYSETRIRDNREPPRDNVIPIREDSAKTERKRCRENRKFRRDRHVCALVTTAGIDQVIVTPERANFKAA